MKSHEVLKQSVEDVGVKTIASDLGVSPSLLYKWCQPGDEPTDSGATNPLDRLAKIFEATGDEQIISWLCQKADGFYCPNPSTEKDLVELAPGQEWSVNVVWIGKQTAKGCKVRNMAKPGAYWAHGRNSSLNSDGVKFVVQ